MAERWLRCQVFKGMFSDELAVRYAPPEAVQAKATSVFVPREAVRGEVDQEGRVRVSVFHERGAGWAVLPTENQLVICVAESDLTSS